MRRVGRAPHREIGEIIAVVAELQTLRGGALIERIEGGSGRQYRIAPADQHVGIIAFGDAMVFVRPGVDFLERET